MSRRGTGTIYTSHYRHNERKTDRLQSRIKGDGRTDNQFSARICVSSLGR